MLNIDTGFRKFWWISWISTFSRTLLNETFCLLVVYKLKVNKQKVMSKESSTVIDDKNANFLLTWMKRYRGTSLSQVCETEVVLKRSYNTVWSENSTRPAVYMGVCYLQCDTH